MRRSRGKMSKRTRLITSGSTIAGAVSRFEEGGRVCISPVCSESGMPHGRYRGRTGIVTGKQGGAYVVDVSGKKLIVPPVHLRRIE